MTSMVSGEMQNVQCANPPQKCAGCVAWGKIRCEKFRSRKNVHQGQCSNFSVIFFPSTVIVKSLVMFDSYVGFNGVLGLVSVRITGILCFLKPL